MSLLRVSSLFVIIAQYSAATCAHALAATLRPHDATTATWSPKRFHTIISYLGCMLCILYVILCALNYVANRVFCVLNIHQFSGILFLAFVTEFATATRAICY